jgi:hypothetical protein
MRRNSFEMLRATALRSASGFPKRHFTGVVMAGLVCFFLPASAQDVTVQPGEAYVTRFSGVATSPGAGGQAVTSINSAGTVGSIIDIRAPGRPPQGEQWMDEPQRLPVTAAEVGQVFGVVFDDRYRPNIYLSATSAFGLHLRPRTAQWMDGMWGPGGGPGTIYRLDAANNYQPRIFTHVMLGNRQNSGAGLGNMAFDRTHKQIFVSDLETGMIHRIRSASGADAGYFDHGTQGRPRFLDMQSKQQGSLPAIAFDPNSRARITDCPSGAFDRSPECWNFAASGRRVWGVGVRNDASRGETRLYYAVWSSPAFGETAWDSASDDDKRNSVWSVRLGPDGSFDTTDVRREFLLPDFFTDAASIARAGYSQPVSDITFSECGTRPVMLLAERGGIRNLGLDAENPFSDPHEARALRYELDQSGGWQPVGRYDVGFYDRASEGPPYLRANCSGGIAFGFGYTDDYASIDQAKPDQFTWMSGHFLCATDSPCRAPNGQASEQTSEQAGQQPASAEAARQGGDPSEVHGIQGTPENAFERLLLSAAFATYPQNGQAYPAAGPLQSYLIDTDINVDQAGYPIEAEFSRNDATKIGDIAIYQVCAPPAPVQPAMLLPPPSAPPPVVAGHDPEITHEVVASHGARSSHFRVASHNPWLSHNEERSHNRWASHDVILSSGYHSPPGSWHRPWGTIHRPRGTVHRPPGTIHRPPGTIHRPPGTHHRPPGTIHRPPGTHHRPPGTIHRPPGTHHRPPGTIHRPPGTHHQPPGTIHRPPGTHHQPPGTIHRPPGTHHRPPGTIHRPPGTHHRPPGTIHRPPGTHHRPPGTIHRPPGTVHRPPGTAHRPPGTAHRPPGSVHRPPGTAHRPPHIQRPPRIHRPERIHRPTRIHRPDRIHRPTRIHRPDRIHRPTRIHQPSRIQRPARIQRPVRMQRAPQFRAPQQRRRH